MDIFLTGGSGFVGQNLIPKLIQAGHTIKALARSEASAEKVKALGATPIRDDLTALSKATESALRSCNTIVHSAAHMDFTYDPEPFYSINVEATKNLLGLAHRTDIQQFIYISAAPVVPGSPIQNLSENQAKAGLPKALYPKTKALAEQAVLKANSATLKTISLRPPAIWGPNNHHYDELFELAEKGQWRWIGGGRHVLSTIHVDNLSNAVLAALKAPIGGQAYFVTDGDRRPMRMTFEAIMRAKGVDPGDKILPRGLAVVAAHLIGGIWKRLGLKSRPPVAPIMIRLMGTEFSVSDQKARTELGYTNAISFEEGIAQLRTT
ncbi:MAG: NAD-dependent epimerase/dehydratase family protein [Bacteroidota bacterium]